MAQVVRGVVRGGRIELIDGPDLVEGQGVAVVIEPLDASEEGAVATPLDDPGLIAVLGRVRRDRRPLPMGPSGPGRASAAGLLADDPEFDAIMAEVERQRRSDFGREAGG